MEKCNTLEFINQQNIAGSTALHHAIDLECPDAAILLLKCGADPFIPNIKGQTPLILACERGLTEVVDYIQKNREIDSALQEQLNNTTIDIKPVVKQPDLLQSFSSLLSSTQSWRTSIEKNERKMKELGPFPRAGMEILLGELEKSF